MTDRLHRRRRGAARLALAALFVALGACDTDGLITVDDPDVVGEPAFLDPSNLPAVHAGALREFQRALGGTTNGEGGQVLYSGLLADELYNSDSFTDRQTIDARQVTIDNTQLPQVFRELQRARSHAEQGAELFAASDSDAGSPEHAELLVLAGFTYVLFGENFCSGVPFSRLPLTGGAPEFGAPKSTAEIFALAVERFDQALALPGASGALASAARVGKARAQLDLGQRAEAAATAAAVPSSFAYATAYSETVGAQNAVFDLVNQERRWSVSASEGGNGLPFAAEGDPRTPARATSGGFTPTVPHAEQRKYTGLAADIPLASGVEARLIEAESLLNGGTSAAYLPVLNALRAAAGLAPLSDPGTAAGRVDQLFKERAYWLWLTSHRLGDLRRLVRQYGRAQSTVFPVGFTVQGNPYGSSVALAVPSTELNNPNFTQTTCDTAVP